MEDYNTTCYSCHHSLDYEAGNKISRREECPHCGRDLRCCMMCQFYDKSAYNECREPCAPRVIEKEKSNFCDFYKIKNMNANIDDKQSLLDAADAIFKK